MKKLITLMLSLAVAGLLSTAAHAADAQATEAKVVKVTGSATVTLPGQSGAVALTEGMSLPAGSVVTTGAGSEVDIQPMAGTLTAIRANSSVSLDELSVTKNDAGVVTKQTAQIALKSGNVVSTLDPARKAINNYGVRTPKGVAAARGTVYSVGVTVDGATTSVATLTGSVTITTAAGVSYQVDIGTGMVIGGTGFTGEAVSLASLVAAEGSTDGAITQAIAAAVETVSASVASGATSGDAAVSILAAVVNVASQANPAAAASFTTTAVAAVASPTASLGSAGSTQAAAAVTEAAVQGAVQTLVATGNTAAAQTVTTQVAAAATTAATSTTGSTITNTSTITSAAATGAVTGTTNAGAPAASAPVVTAPAAPSSPNSPPPAQVVVPPTTSTPITPVDPTVVSPSGGQQ